MTRIETIGDCTLILGDCRDILPTLGKVDAVVTDPPYGIGFKYDGQYEDIGGAIYQDLMVIFKELPKAILQYPEEAMKYLIPIYGAPDDCYFWCYNSNTNRQTRMWSFWGLKPDWEAVKQPCKNPTDGRVNSFVKSYDWCSDVQQVKNISTEKTEHPCQVPNELMMRVIGFLPDAQTILDPFMGSGTTGVACVNLGRSFIGIEREERYFDIACKRIETAYKQPRLFDDKPQPKPEQTSMLEAFK